VTDERPAGVPFEAHVELIRVWLSQRAAIVERIEDVLNAQRQPAALLQDRALLTRQLDDCLFGLTALSGEQRQLRGQLQEVHWASGFRPRHAPGLHNDLIHPAEMAIRVFYLWQQSRWPGRNGRVRFAHTLFNVCLLRNLEFLSLRIWDVPSDDDAREVAASGDAAPGDRIDAVATDAASARLAQIQALLDRVWSEGPADQPALVRDARWLIPLAQSPTTDELGGYFNVAEHVTDRLLAHDRTAVASAEVRVLAGHLTSQIRHYCIRDRVPIEAPGVVLRTRTSNALDFALLIQYLVPLLEAYAQVVDADDGARRFALAGAICQGISADPEVFVDRVDLLGAYSMIEHLFVTTNADGHVVWSAKGRRHVERLRRYVALIGRLRPALADDCPAFRPVAGACSAYGVIFGTPSHLTEHMALKATQRDAMTRYSLEDLFTDKDTDRDKIAWVDGWRDLPHIDRELQRQHAYPHEFAAAIFARVERTLCAPADRAGRAADRRGRLFVVLEGAADSDATLQSVPQIPARFVGASDATWVADGRAVAYDETQLLRDRLEGHFVVSCKTGAGWIAIRKDVLTEVLGAGQDARISGLPRVAAEALALMAPGNVVLVDAQASVPPSTVNA